MKNNNPKIILAFFSILVGMLIASQIKLQVDLIVPVTIKSFEDTQNEINLINSEIIELNGIIKQKEEELQILENILVDDRNIEDILLEDLKYNMTISGRTTLEGPGIQIVMYDNMDTVIEGFDLNDYIIHDVDILNVINDLKIAGAEAISINDQRVISASEIKCGGPIIRINDRSIATPFVIKAIGDPKLLMASVNAPGTYGDTLRSVFAIGFEPEAKDKVVIPAYIGGFSYKYANSVEEGD
ncbi:MAG: DUF881 domain-containing protein [Tissierellia bacterium]|nr:DUF881 domain-containing protein [Tissierellia bacterium]MDD4725578.1 DUF881 domain-containing protein [Tissierellia bacterium]